MDATVKVDCDFLGIPRGLKLCWTESGKIGRCAGLSPTRVTIEEPFNGQYSVVYGGITENDRCLYNLYNQLSISTSPQVILTSLNHEPGKHAMTR